VAPIRASAQAVRCAGTAYNVAGGKPHSILDLQSILQQHLGVDLEVHHLPTRAGDVRHSCADSTAAAADLGFHADVSFDEGLRRTLSWFAAR
jgi:UDP-glucose 4-epimerase